MTGDLVGPMPAVRFRGGSPARLVADPPQSTMDLRYLVCTDHHTACDCREAELNELIAEARFEAIVQRRMEEACTAVLRLHTESSTGSCRVCLNRHPCPTRVLLLPHSWITRYEENR